MNKAMVKQYVGKKCMIILKNNFSYTAIIPEFDGTAFDILDKFGEHISIESDFIMFIREVKE